MRLSSVEPAARTCHEQLEGADAGGHPKRKEDVDLVHMNGRVYDPTIGRFLSADPFVRGT